MDCGTGLVGRASLSAGSVEKPPSADRGGVGRGASRGREPREMAIFTRPAVDFDKRGTAAAFANLIVCCCCFRLIIFQPISGG